MKKLERTDLSHKRKRVRITWAVVLLLLTTFIGHAQIEKGSSDRKASSSDPQNHCSENPDRSYNRKQTLMRFAELLNDLIPEYRKINGRGFVVENDRSIGFFVQDLTDLSNSGISLDNCIDFIDGHIYHFSPIKRRFSFSHIAFLEDGELRIFSSINCKDKGDSLDDVLAYLDNKLATRVNKQELLKRVKEFRKYGLYSTVDAIHLECEETA